MKKKFFPNVIIVAKKVKSSFVLKSKYVKKGWLVSSYEEAAKIMIGELQFPNPALVYACCDDAASFLDKNYDRLSKHFVLPGMKQQGSLSDWTRKDKMALAASEIGMEIPRSWDIDQDSDLSKILYPCITKSITSVGKGKSEFHLCGNEAELSDFLHQLQSKEKIQVQQYIDKEFEFQLLGCSLKEGEEVIIPGRTYIPETHGYNNITFLQYDAFQKNDNADTVRKAIEFVKLTKYTGLFSIEFMRGKDGKDYFLEMNFRNDGNGLCVTRSGTNLPYIYYLYQTGGDYKKEIENSKVSLTYSSPEDSYFMSMLNGEIPFKKWWKNMKKVNCWITYYKNNSAPFWHLIWLQKRPLCVTMARRLLGIFKTKKQ